MANTVAKFSIISSYFCLEDHIFSLGICSLIDILLFGNYAEGSTHYFVDYFPMII